MKWHKVTDFPGQVDLSELHAYFDQRGVVHRFIETGSRQELWIANEQLLADVSRFIEAWQQGNIRLETVPNQPNPRQRTGNGKRIFLSFVQTYPFTLLIIALGVVGYILASPVQYTGWWWQLTFQGYQLSFAGPVAEPVLEGLRRGEVWRLITPTFLHFNILHIVFNGLWIWEFGRRLESYFSTLNYLLIFFITALGANVIQFIMAGDAPFGGLSGVVYGYMGVLFVASRIAPSNVLTVPPGIFGFMLVWLALGVFGVIDLFIPGPAAVGNGAHLGGLLSGLLLGYLLLIKANRSRD